MPLIASIVIGITAACFVWFTWELAEALMRVIKNRKKSSGDDMLLADEDKDT